MESELWRSSQGLQLSFPVLASLRVAFSSVAPEGHRGEFSTGMVSLGSYQGHHGVRVQTQWTLGSQHHLHQVIIR